jgi:sugar phosphate isomerase/epimerase
VKKISIGSWAYTIGPYADHPVDWDTVCTRLRDLGFDGVELGGFAPHPNPDDLPRERWGEVRAGLDERGLGVSGLAANLWHLHLADTDDHSQYLTEFRRNCEFAQALGIAGIRVDTVQPPTLLQTEDEATVLRRITTAFSEATRIAADHGLYLTWEFEPGFVLNKPSDLQRVLDAVDHPAFGVLYDTSHGHMVSVVGARHEGGPEVLPGGQVELIAQLSGRINHIHLIDSDNSCHKNADGEDETSLHLPFGEGVVDFPPILRALAAEQLSHDWWTVDLCFWPDAWQATKDCKTFMDQVNQEYFA